MKMVLIGHRGVGKTRLLDRLKVYYKDTEELKFFDLDREIEFREGKTIAQIFQNFGETQFRDLEVKVFRDLTRENADFVIALGAGFSLQEIPKDYQCVWVRRKTDILGRIFLNRPRLSSDVSPLEEYLQRLPFREQRYMSHATEEYLMPEGIENPNLIERDIFQKNFKDLGGILTLLPQHFQHPNLIQERVRLFEVDYFELRDDLLSLSQIQQMTTLLPAGRTLLSLRKASPDPWLQEFLKTGVLWDWALELGPCPFGEAPIFSIHQVPPHYLEDLGALEAFLERFHIPGSSMIKLAPVVESFEQLVVLLHWQRGDPARRSVLPRTSAGHPAGRWAWVRQWLKGKQKINFLRVDQGSAKDQPTLFDWMSTPAPVEKFAAVLGHPVDHSRTPVEHQGYFTKKNMPVFAIDIPEAEFSEALGLLRELGLQAAAVTAPLKMKAAMRSQQKSPLVVELESANTLQKISGAGGWRAHNTDLDGFRAAFSQITEGLRSVAVWGGGGTLPVILKICPRALCFSARTGKIKLEYGDQSQWSRDELVSFQLEGPQILIWAASPEAAFPPEDWRPEFVLDLNYREDSLAREYALRVHAQYIDGLCMFREQARAQREFWDREQN